MMKGHVTICIVTLMTIQKWLICQSLERVMLKSQFGSPLMKISKNKETTKSAPLTYNEKVSLMNKIQPKIRWCDIEEGGRYHVSAFLEKKKKRHPYYKEKRILLRVEINGASNVMYIPYILIV